MLLADRDARESRRGAEAELSPALRLVCDSPFGFLTLVEEQGRITPATIADHHPPHGGDYNKFVLGPLRSLCRDCHQGAWATDKRGYSSAIGDDGLPIDPKHPFNRQM